MWPSSGSIATASPPIWRACSTLPASSSDVDSGLASGVGGTPSFFVNGRLHRGSFDAASLIVVIER